MQIFLEFCFESLTACFYTKYEIEYSACHDCMFWLNISFDENSNSRNLKYLCWWCRNSSVINTWNEHNEQCTQWILGVKTFWELINQVSRKVSSRLTYPRCTWLTNQILPRENTPGQLKWAGKSSALFWLSFQVCCQFDWAHRQLIVTFNNSLDLVETCHRRLWSAKGARFRTTCRALLLNPEICMGAISASKCFVISMIAMAHCLHWSIAEIASAHFTFQPELPISCSVIFACHNLQQRKLNLLYILKFLKFD